MGESTHARRELKAAHRVGQTEDNLDRALQAERERPPEEYRKALAAVREAGNRRAETALRWAREGDYLRADLLQGALEAVRAGRDWTTEGLWLCRVCGYVHGEAEAPGLCPVCGSPRDQFVAV